MERVLYPLFRFDHLIKKNSEHTTITFNNKKLKMHNFTLCFRFFLAGVGQEIHCKT